MPLLFYLHLSLMKLVFSFILILSFNAVVAQKLNGRVIDDEDNPIPFANVYWKRSNIGTIGDLEGVFNIDVPIEKDTLVISATGFIDLFISKNKAVSIGVFKLLPSITKLEQVEVAVKKKRKRRRRKTDPAYLLHQKIAKHRELNDIKLRPTYNCEVYNKVEIDLNNIDSNTKNEILFKPISFVFDHPDSVSQKKTFAPIFISEGLSNFSFQYPNSKKEHINAAMNAGIKVPSIAQYTGNVYTDFNIYKNYVLIFQKSFISPLAPASWLSYKYFLADSTVSNDTTYYRLEFIPIRKQDLAFRGYLITNNRTYGLNEIHLEIPSSANINFIEEFKIDQYFVLSDTVLVPQKEQILIDINPFEKTYGFYIQKTTIWDNFNFSPIFSSDHFTSAQKVQVGDSAYNYGAEILSKNRPVALSSREALTYAKIDSAMNTGYMKRIQNLSQMLYTGFYPFKLWEYGPYYSTYSFNNIEGNRIRFGFLTTQDLLKKTRFRGYLAHGVGDGVTKYGAIVTQYYGFTNWRYLELEHLNDFKILSASDNAFQEDNILASLSRRVDPRYTHTIKTRLTWSHEWYNGINNSISLKSERFIPIGVLDYYSPDGNKIKTLDVYTVKLGGRFALHEKFVQYGFRRLSLGTRKPRFDYFYTYGAKINNRGYEFHKVELEMTDRYYLGYIGFIDLKVLAGKIFGKLPYPLLLNHQGNDSYYYDNEAFNLMNPFEFVSDEEISILARHNFNGLILNQIPLLKKMKLRSFVFSRGVYGRLNTKHENIVVLPESLSELRDPYLEAGFGVENIFKLIRLDFIWRLTNLQSAQAQPFGITFNITPSF